ncbi:MAG: nucleoside triphosphate pyrophosphohydrolase [Gammaproteobacteria bacterium]|nr:nucleoside triphosphate pyrophosphohydrolase [Gammaproteobacteria bacterium]
MSIDKLLALMAALRDPERGCPWDREQNFSTIAPYTIEEAYEVADAIARDDMVELRDELGDLLFQVVFHARMAEEAGEFDFDDVIAAIVEKMIRRHPHVFADEVVADAEEQTRAWEEHKARERRNTGVHHSLLDGVTLGLPALSRAAKLQKRAARAGFDWPAVEGVMDKIEEELNEVRAELEAKDTDALQGEIGDLLFACVNLARHAGVDAEEALRAANHKFERRFRYMESSLQQAGGELEQCSLEEMDRQWELAKRELG